MFWHQGTETDLLPGHYALDETLSFDEKQRIAA